MGVRARTIGLVLVASILLWIIPSIAGIVHTMQTANDADRAEVSEALDRGVAAIANSQDRLTSLCNDWAVWDDTYRFVQQPSDAYVQGNLNDNSLSSLRVDFMVFLDRTGRIVQAKAIDPQTHRQSQLPPDVAEYLGRRPALVTRPSGGAVSTALSLAHDAYLLAAQPIVKSDRTGAPDGTFVTGFRFGPQQIADLRKLVAVPLTVSSAIADPMPTQPTPTTAVTGRTTSQAVSLSTGNSASGYRQLPGLGGQPGVLLHVVTPRKAAAAAQSSIMATEGIVALFGLVVFAAFALILDSTILKRLTDLGAAVRDVTRHADDPVRVPVAGDDEISWLANDINVMLDRLDSSRSELRFLAIHDPLTGLSNRRLFEQELERELDEQGRLGTTGAIIWFDLDHFKDINDSLGHATGDEVLIAFGAYLRSQSRAYSTVARLGGDEFALLVPHVGGDEVVLAARRLLEGLASRTFLAGSHDVRVSASVGVVVYPEHGAQTTELLSRADLAMYDAKAKGGNQVVLYQSDDGWQSRMQQRIEAAERIIVALREDRFVLHAQPIRPLGDAHGEYYELLLRMKGRDNDLIPPGEIIPTAERLGLIRDIDRWVVRRAIHLLSAAESMGRDIFFTVNLSGCAFSDPLLLEAIRDTLRETGASPERLVLEITETTTIANIDAARAFIRELKAIGCRFSLDDFGSGVSSFYYLKHLAIDFLKIDGSLVKGMQQDSADEHFVKAIVQMCQGLGIQTVAEYAETEAISKTAELMGVDFLQGYYVGRPKELEAYFGRQLEKLAQADERADFPVPEMPSMEAV